MQSDWVAYTPFVLSCLSLALPTGSDWEVSLRRLGHETNAVDLLVEFIKTRSMRFKIRDLAAINIVYSDVKIAAVAAAAARVTGVASAHVLISLGLYHVVAILAVLLLASSGVPRSAEEPRKSWLASLGERFSIISLRLLGIILILACAALTRYCTFLLS